MQVVDLRANFLKSTCPFSVCVFEALAVDSCHKYKVETNAKTWPGTFVPPVVIVMQAL